MDYDDAIAFWWGRLRYDTRPQPPGPVKLARMRALLDRLGAPQDRFRIVHVTGTKGKGSTAAMVAAVLRESGYHVGLYTSPHLTRVEERFQVDGEEISRRELAARVAEVAPVVDRLAVEWGAESAPSFFEIETALGFLHFHRRRVDVAVVEVGIGGRFDRTNVCRPLASVITSVSLDHAEQLGGSLEAGGAGGRRVTSWPSLRTDLRNAGAEWVDEEVAVDGALVTSRKPDDIPAFNREAVKLFASRPVSA